MPQEIAQKSARSIRIPESELMFHFSRSGGPGGQNVNKVSTRVELLFDLNATRALTQEEKQRVFAKLGSRIDSNGILHVVSQESRSQWKNRRLVVEKLLSLLHHALARNRKRVATEPSAASKQRRIARKKIHASKKAARGRILPPLE